MTRAMHRAAREPRYEVTDIEEGNLHHRRTMTSRGRGSRLRSAWTRGPCRRSEEKLSSLARPCAHGGRSTTYSGGTLVSSTSSTTSAS
jgi:hypothetical protein